MNFLAFGVARPMEDRAIEAVTETRCSKSEHLKEVRALPQQDLSLIGRASEAITWQTFGEMLVTTHKIKVCPQGSMVRSTLSRYTQGRIGCPINQQTSRVDNLTQFIAKTIHCKVKDSSPLSGEIILEENPLSRQRTGIEFQVLPVRISSLEGLLMVVSFSVVLRY